MLNRQMGSGRTEEKGEAIERHTGRRRRKMKALEGRQVETGSLLVRVNGRTGR